MTFKKVEISIGLIKFKSSYVCLKRNKKPYEDFIEFPGGKKKDGEDAAQCLIREIKEELNIKISKFKYISSIKHLYKDNLITINVFNIHRFSGNILSNENREIVFYNAKSTHSVLPTHNRILNLLKIPKLLKIITTSHQDNEVFQNINLYKYIRLRDICYETYKSHTLQMLEKYQYRGSLIVDYPFNEEWEGAYAGIHYKSNNIIDCIDYKKNNKYIYSASCHTSKDIELSNKVLFDFITISPVVSSPYNHEPIGWNNFSALSELSYMPTYALGGMKSLGEDLSNCCSNKGFGLAGIKSI